MRTIWQVRRAAFGRTLRAIGVSATCTPRNKQTTSPPRTYHWRSIGTAALLACAFLLPAFAAQAQVATNTTLGSSQNPSTVNSTVVFTATITPTMASANTPMGSVTFQDVINFPTIVTLGTSPVSAGAGGTGVAMLSISTLTTGKHQITAAYTSSDSNFNGSSTANVLNQQVLAAGVVGTTTQLLSSQNPSEVNQSVTFMATVTANSGNTTPSGNVSFQDNGTQIGTGTLNGAGVATFTTTTLTAGNHPITAVYNFDNGNASFAGSTSNTVMQNVTNGIPTVVSVSAPSVVTVNQPFTITATVTVASGFTGTPTGTVQFQDTTAGANLGAANLTNGAASINNVMFTTTTTHNIVATYTANPTTFETGTTGTASVIVSTGTAATAKIMSSQNPSVLGNPVTFTITIAPQSGTGTPTGMVTIQDTAIGSGFSTTLTLSGGSATLTTNNAGMALVAGTNTISVSYNGDPTFAGSTASLTQTVNNVNSGSTTTTLTASPNPATLGQAVTFTATVHVVSGTGTPSGTVTIKDGATTIGTGNAPGPVTLTTSSLSSGSHSITAVYSGDTNFNSSTSAAVIEQIGSSADSIKLREMQISTTPVIAQAWGQSTAAAMDDAVSAGFGGNPQSLSPSGTGFTYYFNDDAPTQRSSDTDQDSLRRYLASPNGSLTSPDGKSLDPKSAAASDSTKRVDDDFRAMGYAGGMPTKAPPPPSSTPHDWLAWVTVRGTDYFRGTFGDDLKGDQVDALIGLTRRISPNFVIGAFGGYEHFDYSSQAFNSVLKGDGWTAGAYLGWKLAPNLRLDAGAAWSDIFANDTAGTANGNFTGTRWLVNGGLTGTYPWQMQVLEPSARVFAIWEHENAFTDSLGTLQAARNFETGRASAGVKAIYPFAWTSSTVALSPYAGLYADYYFSKDDAQTAGLTTVPLLQGFSARATGGVAASFAGGASLLAGGEFGGIGSATHIWTWTARGQIPF